MHVTRRDVLESAAVVVLASALVAPFVASGRQNREKESRMRSRALMTLRLATSATGEIAGHLIRSRPCYICKQHYTQVDAFYHQLCPECALFSHSKRDARTDLTCRASEDIRAISNRKNLNQKNRLLEAGAKPEFHERICI